ncbi:hypothetical protein RDABS01_005819 [Bienertia sinuspersici]
MEAAYKRLKNSQILLEEEGIRAISLAYMKQNKFYMLGEFLKKLFTKRVLAMVKAGFKPDITTFNIRALAFSKMNLFWDLHLSLDHMKHENIVPDIITYGCVVDAYMDKKMSRNLDFALEKIINLDEFPLIETDSLVIEVMGEGRISFEFGSVYGV